MSQRLALLIAGDPRKKMTRSQALAIVPSISYEDGRTLQCHKDECDINKIMARFAVTNTITHLSKHQGQYADFSDFDFQEQTQKLTRGREIFDDLPAEVRREFGQSPAAFFAYVNDPANIDDLHNKIPGLAEVGDQLPDVKPLDADQAAAAAAKQSLDVEVEKTPKTSSASAEPT